MFYELMLKMKIKMQNPAKNKVDDTFFLVQMEGKEDKNRV